MADSYLIRPPPMTAHVYTFHITIHMTLHPTECLHPHSYLTSWTLDGLPIGIVIFGSSSPETRRASKLQVAQKAPEATQGLEKGDVEVKVNMGEEAI